MANLLLAERGSAPVQTVSEKWVYNFIDRHTELKAAAPDIMIISVLNVRTQWLLRRGLIRYKLLYYNAAWDCT
jgi:hypothetical protein